VDARFRQFHRIGPKKAAMGVELLVTHLGIELGDLTGTNVAYDVHVRRVFLRAGLVASDSITEVTAAARRLNPERPGLIDLPTWLIGRRWCRPTAPDCATCPLGSTCRRQTQLQIRS
jgi:endonuclease III